MQIMSTYHVAYQYLEEPAQNIASRLLMIFTTDPPKVFSLLQLAILFLALRRYIHSFAILFIVNVLA